MATAVFEGRREGRTLKAKCEGSQGGPYRIRVDLSADGIASATCSCPVGGHGRCKHVAAVLLAWQDDPERFPGAESTEAILAKLDNPSETPSINPSHAALAPIVARNAGITDVAISCDQSLNSDARPMPSTVRFSQRT